MRPTGRRPPGTRSRTPPTPKPKAATTSSRSFTTAKKSESSDLLLIPRVLKALSFRLARVCGRELLQLCRSGIRLHIGTARAAEQPRLREPVACCLADETQPRSEFPRLD